MLCFFRMVPVQCALECLSSMIIRGCQQGLPVIDSFNVIHLCLLYVPTCHMCRIIALPTQHIWMHMTLPGNVYIVQKIAFFVFDT